MMEYTQIGFLITALLAVSGCLWWLVKKIIQITTDCIKENTKANVELKHAIRSLERTIETKYEKL